MLQIDSASWHAKVYQSWHQRKYGYTENGANLCKYCRVVLFWSWLRTLFCDGRVGKIRIPMLSWGGIMLFLEGAGIKFLRGFGDREIKFAFGPNLW